MATSSPAAHAARNTGRRARTGSEPERAKARARKPSRTAAARTSAATATGIPQSSERAEISRARP